MKLSKNFSLSEFLISEAAARHDISMDPPDWIVANLKRLCETVLQPLRDDLDSPIIVTSGWRPKALNTLIGGSETSDHILGLAADIRAIDYKPADIVVHAEALDLPYKQLILEFNSWAHISAAQDGKPAARQLLTALRENGATVYRAGLHA